MKPTSDNLPGPDPLSPTPTVTFWAATLRVLLASLLWGGERSGTDGVDARS